MDGKGSSDRGLDWDLVLCIRSPELRKKLVSFLRDPALNIQTTWAESTSGAMEIVQYSAVTAVIVEVTDVNGLEIDLLDRIYREASSLPVFALMNGENKEITSKLYELGVVDRVDVKEISRDLLLSALQSCIKRKYALVEFEVAKTSTSLALSARQEFLGRVGHELRTPLNGILGFASMLLETEEDPVRREWLEVIRAGGENQLRTINEILHVSEMLSGALVIAPTVEDFRGWFGQIEREVESLCQQTSLTCVVDIAADIPTYLEFDGDRLGQILLRLCANAVRFTCEGGLVVRVSRDTEASISGQSQEKPIVLCIGIADSGKGVDVDKLPVIFEPFMQGEELLTRTHEGLGLGLTIAQELAKLMGGDIEVRTKEGRGSAFIVRIPVTEVGLKHGKRKSAVIEQWRPEQARILVVEDNPVNRKLLSKMLDSLGCAVEEAVDGEDGIAKFCKSSYDCVLMDIHMPGKNGLQATEVMRSYERESGKLTPILAVTADSSSQNLLQCEGVGMNGSLIKPFSKEELLETLYGVLG